MTGPEHILAWIESSKPHYDRLLNLELVHKSEVHKPFATAILYVASELVKDAFREATRGGDIYLDDITALDLCDAIKFVLTWELEQ